MRRHTIVLLVIFFWIVYLASCDQADHHVVNFPVSTPFKTLSEYQLYQGSLKDLKPGPEVLPYTVTNELFTDYAWKQRLVWMPDSVQAAVGPDGVVDFPVGTMLVKTFYYPQDFRNPTGNRKIIETRLLINNAGTWDAWTYLWNEEQTEAYLDKVGTTMQVNWTDEMGAAKSTAYQVPNKNQCKNCHRRGNTVEPLGPRYQNMVRASGVNQLEAWVQRGFLAPLPSTLTSLALMPHWQDTLASLEDRAKAYLDVNCWHCHRPDGPGGTSGLYMQFGIQRPADWGIHKPPVAAGKGSGDMQYDIAPGAEDSSILVYRMESLDPGVMMPELGRTLVHEEAVALIKHWINRMPH